MRKISLLLIIVLFVPLLNGQQKFYKRKPAIVKSVGFMNYPLPQSGDEDRTNDRMEMMMTWKLTNDLDLTPEQADKFFPRFKEHRENMNALEKEIIDVSEKIKDKIDKGKEISSKELDEALENINELEIQKIDEKQRFINEMEEYLTANQIAKLALFKHYFIKDLRKEIRRRPRGGA